MNWAWASSLDELWRSPTFPMWLTMAAAGFFAIVLLVTLLRAEKSVANGALTVITLLAIGVAVAATIRGFGTGGASTEDEVRVARAPAGVTLPALACLDDLAGDLDGGREVLNRVLDAGRVGAAAEAVGVARGSMDMTIDYLKQRKQFGKLIGEFQALQHRAAHLYSEVEIARAVVIKAQQLLDAGAENASLMASVAKAKVGKAAGLAVKEGVQMHGGIGMTDEYDIGLYMKRDRALAEFMGDVYYHADRVARMSGY